MKDIQALIPQRIPFVMIEELIEVTDHSATSGYIVPPDNIFVYNGFLTEPALIENIAQTAAARIGYLCKEKNEPVPVGFIGAVQKLEISDLPKIGETLETKILIKNQVFNVTVISGAIQTNGKTLAQCEMKIFIQSSQN